MNLACVHFLQPSEWAIFLLFAIQTRKDTGGREAGGCLPELANSMEFAHVPVHTRLYGTVANVSVKRPASFNCRIR